MRDTKIARAKLLDLVVVNQCFNADLGERIAAPSQEFIARAIGEHDEVRIVSGFYDVEYLLKLFGRKAIKRRREKEINVVVGCASGPAMREQLQELKSMRKKLVERGYSEEKVAIHVAEGGAFLHAKVYEFRKPGVFLTLVGSANASENGLLRNNELLVAIRGSHTPLRRYIDTVFDRAGTPEKVEARTPLQKCNKIDDLLREGWVYFKPVRAVAWTVDCLSVNPAVRTFFDKHSDSPLPYHSEISAGMLNLPRLLRMDTKKLEESPSTAGRSSIKPYAVETCFGYWVPASWKDELQHRLDEAAKGRIEHLISLGRKLEKVKMAQLEKRVAGYIKEIDKKLRELKSKLALSTDEKKEVAERIRQRFERLRDILNSQEECRYLASVYDGSPAPEIWEDYRSRADFVRSFCEDVAWRNRSRPKNVSKIVRHLGEQFELQRDADAKAIERSITNSLSRHPRSGKEIWTQ